MWLGPCPQIWPIFRGTIPALVFAVTISPADHLGPYIDRAIESKLRARVGPMVVPEHQPAVRFTLVPIIRTAGGQRWVRACGRERTMLAVLLMRPAWARIGRKGSS